MKKNLHIAIIINPLHIYETPSLGVAILVGILRKHGYKTTLYDWNIECKNELKDTHPSLWKQHHLWQYDYFNNSIRETVFPLIDKKIEEVVNTEPDVIGFSTLTCNITTIKYVLKKMKPKLKHTKFIMGGSATYLKLCESLVEDKSIDYMLVGDAEESLPLLLNAIEKEESPGKIPGIAFLDDNGRLFQNPPAIISDLNSVPYPDFSGFNFSYYTNPDQLPISFSRGCKNRCTFCSAIFFVRKYRFRNADSIYEEMKSNIKRFERNSFICTDLLINGSLESLRELSEKIITSGLKCHWGGSARVDKYMSFELLERMKKAGLTFLIFGIESGSQKVLTLMRKNYMLKDASRILKMCRKLRITIVVNILIGYPGESVFDFIRTLFFLLINRLSIYKVNVSTLSVFPGVELYYHPDRFNIIPTDVGIKWISKDGKNTYAVRMARTKVLKLFLRMLMFPEI